MDIDLYFAGTLIAFCVAVTGWTQLWIKLKETKIGKPLLAVGVTLNRRRLDLVVKNAGSGAAIRIVISARGEFDGVRVYTVDALGPGDNTELNSLYSRSS